MSGSWITPVRRLGIYIRDNFTCQYCGTCLKNADSNLVTLDHLVPRNPLVSHGSGGNESSNLVMSCKSCNSSRQDKEWDSYATGGAIERIETQRHAFVNIALAKAILSGKVPAEIEKLESKR